MCTARLARPPRRTHAVVGASTQGMSQDGGGTGCRRARSVRGGWYRDADARVQLQLLEKPGQGARRALQQLAEELTAWLDGVQTSPKFPSRWMTARAACCPTAARGGGRADGTVPMYGCGQTTWSLGILAPPDWNPADAIDRTQPLWAVYVGQLGPPTTCQPPIRHTVTTAWFAGNATV
jgi:hypothetical protein